MPQGRDPVLHQQTFDFPRSAKLRWLERMVIPSFVRQTGKAAGTIARTHRLKSLLKALDSFARDAATCRVGYERLAKCVGCSEDTVVRAIADAEELSLIVCRRSAGRGKRNEYAIAWSAVERHVPPEDRFVGDTGPPAKTPQLAAKTPQLAAKTPQLAAPYHTPLNANGNRHCGNGDLKSGNGGWPWHITADRLRSPAGVQQMFLHAVTAGWCPMADRLRLFTLSASCRRRAAEAKHPEKAAAWFTGALRRKLWGGSQADEEWARQAIRAVDGASDLPRTSNIDPEADAAAERDRTRAAFQAWAAAKRSD